MYVLLIFLMLYNKFKKIIKCPGKKRSINCSIWRPLLAMDKTQAAFRSCPPVCDFFGSTLRTDWPLDIRPCVKQPIRKRSNTVRINLVPDFPPSCSMTRFKRKFKVQNQILICILTN